MLKLLLDTRPHDEKHGYFGGNHLNLILIDFINHDLPKSGEENYYKVWATLLPPTTLPLTIIMMHT